MSQICFLNVNLPLKRGHLSVQDTLLPGPQGVHNKGVPLYVGCAAVTIPEFLALIFHYTSEISVFQSVCVECGEGIISQMI